MAEYHGDIASQFGNALRTPDDTNYFVASLLLIFLGQLGIHRFYMGDQRMAFGYFFSFAAAAFASFATLDGTFLIWEMSIAGVALLCELALFIYRMVRAD